MNSKILEDLSSEVYLSGDILHINNDDVLEIKHEINNIRNISYFTMIKLLCSMLNTSKHSIVYFGLNSNFTIKGISATRAERDGFRCGINNIMTNKIEPKLSHTNYKINFIPVLRTQDVCISFNEENLKYVIEVHIYPVRNTMYKTEEGEYYLRKDGVTICANKCGIRQWVG
ncbi:schlafen-like protein 1 [Centruroides sculpturatus]|nr:schlafen-like protein 1 [Centruroides sculpturatus]